MSQVFKETDLIPANEFDPHEEWEHQNSSEEEHPHKEKFKEYLNILLTQVEHTLKHKVLDRECSCCNKKFYSGSVCLQCKNYMHMACLDEDNKNQKSNKKLCHGSSIKSLNYRVCPKCKYHVRIGVQCLSCSKVYHAKCMNIINCSHPKTIALIDEEDEDCYKCRNVINNGYKCVVCWQNYHAECSKTTECCPHYFTVCVKMDIHPCHENLDSNEFHYFILKHITQQKEQYGKSHLCLKCGSIFHNDCFKLCNTSWGCDHSSTVESNSCGEVCCYKDCLHDMWNVHLRRLEYDVPKVPVVPEKQMINWTKTVPMQLKAVGDESSDNAASAVEKDSSTSDVQNLDESTTIIDDDDEEDGNMDFSNITDLSTNNETLEDSKVDVGEQVINGGEPIELTQTYLMEVESKNVTQTSQAYPPIEIESKQITQTSQAYPQIGMESNINTQTNLVNPQIETNSGIQATHPQIEPNPIVQSYPQTQIESNPVVGVTQAYPQIQIQSDPVIQVYPQIQIEPNTVFQAPQIHIESNLVIQPTYPQTQIESNAVVGATQAYPQIQIQGYPQIQIQSNPVGQTYSQIPIELNPVVQRTQMETESNSVAVKPESNEVMEIAKDRLNRIVEEATGKTTSMFGELSIVPNNKTVNEEGNDSIKLLSAVIEDVHKEIVMKDAEKTNVNNDSDITLIEEGNQSNVVKEKEVEVEKIPELVPFKQKIKVVDIRSIMNVCENPFDVDEDDDDDDEDDDEDDEKEEEDEEIILDHSLDTSKRKTGSISINFLKKKLKGKMTNDPPVPAPIAQSSSTITSPNNHSIDNILDTAPNQIVTNLPTTNPIITQSPVVATNEIPVPNTTLIGTNGIAATTTTTTTTTPIENNTLKLVTTSGTDIPPVMDTSSIKSPIIKSPIIKSPVVKPKIIKPVAPSPEKINGVVVCYKCKHPPANPTTCPTCKQVFHPGCISSGFFNSTICTHMNNKNDNNYQTCDYCSRKVLMFIECKHCDKAFHASCMKRAIKSCVRDFSSCMHRPHSSTICEECMLYVENPIICSKCGKFYHQVCFNQINPSLNKCQHLSTFKLFDEEEAVKLIESRSAIMKQMDDLKLNSMRMKHASNASFLGDMGLRRVFDFMLINDVLPLRSVDAYISSFMELEINIAKCPVYQQRACVTLLTKYINEWALWKKEVHPEYEVLLREKEEYKIQKDAGLVTKEWSNVTSYQRFLRHKKVWNTKLFNYLKHKFIHVMPMLSVDHDAIVTINGQPTTNYAVCIEGPPRNLNSIVFTLEGNDVTLKKHSDKPFNATMLNYRQFMNHPYVNIHLQIADLDVKRCNVHEYDRYIMKGGVNIELSEPQRVYSVWRINPEIPVQVYTYLYFSKYFEQLDELMTTNPQILPSRTNEIKTFLTEFLNDIADMNMKKKTMATNTSVALGIGCNKYIRSKQTTMKDINFWEVLTPKVVVSLNRFTPTQDCHDMNKISFRTLNKYSVLTSHFAKDINTSCIIYECNLCNLSFKWYYEIHDHFTEVHREENAVICWKCGESVEIHELTNSRWQHGCSV